MTMIESTYEDSAKKYHTCEIKLKNTAPVYTDMDSKTTKRIVSIVSSVTFVAGSLYFMYRITKALELAADGHAQLGAAFRYGSLRVYH